MDWKTIGIKVFKGAVYGAFGSVTSLQVAGVHGLTNMLKALAGAGVSGALTGAHSAIQQVREKE